jgi:hypothetical protein
MPTISLNKGQIITIYNLEWDSTEIKNLYIKRGFI